MPSATANWRTGTHTQGVGQAVTDEQRLLGSCEGYDPTAIPIATPQSRLMPKLAINGGVKPINTLGHQRSSPGFSSKRTIEPRSRVRRPEPLELETSRGTNVIEKPFQEGVFDRFALPPAKRRKTTRQARLSDSSGSPDELLDTLSPKDINFTAIQTLNRVPPGRSRGSSFEQNTAAAWGKLTEHKSVERMMDSKPRHQPKTEKYQTTGREEQIDMRDHTPHLLSPTSTPTPNLIDISGEDNIGKDSSRVNKSFRPPGRSSVSHLQDDEDASMTDMYEADPERVTAETSPFFGLPRQQWVKPTSPSAQGDVQRRPSNQPKDDSERLADAFVGVDGHRRGSDVHMSSEGDDELQLFGTTIRQHPKLAISIHSQCSSQSSPKRSSSSITSHASIENCTGLEPSNIKPTFFHQSRPKGERNIHLAGDPLREATKPWGTGLDFVIAGGKLWEGKDYGLVYDEKHRCYQVENAEIRVTAEDMSLRILPDKLIRIDFGDSGGKVRFTSSRCGNEDNIIDIQFQSEKDTSQLLKRLSMSATAKVHPQSSAHMDKIFAKRRGEGIRRSQTSNSTRSLVAHPDLVQQKRRQEEAKTIPKSSDANHTKQPRKGNIVNDLLERATREETSAEDPASKPESTPIPHGLPDSGNIESVLTSLRPLKLPNHNDHLRRSTRSSGRFQQLCADSLSNTDDQSLTTGYSRIHGLGDPWKKPLTYPNVGKKKTTVEWSDLERLDEDVFLNDNLISFYLRFLEQRLEDERPDLAKRVYFFNTYFYATLTNAHKGKRAFNYEGVQKWTRTVDIFTYDYIIVPINEAGHWYLAIICNLPALDRNLGRTEATMENHAHKEIDAASKLTTNESETFAPFSSSPVEDSVKERPARLDEEIQKPDVEEGTRHSFAEMSLGNDGHESAWVSAYIGGSQRRSSPNLHDETNDILDKGLENARPVDHTVNRIDGHLDQSVGRIDDNVGRGEHRDQGQRASGKSKNQKRKSMPPSTRIDSNKPVIITFDSLGLGRGPTRSTIKKYLHEEAKTKRGGMEFEDTDIKGISAKHIPQQTNFSDCGLFLLGYVEKFLEEDPKGFVSKIIKYELDEQKDWAKLIPSKQRSSIREQIQQLHAEQQSERQVERKVSADKGNGGGGEIKEPNPLPSDIDTKMPIKLKTPEPQGRTTVTDRVKNTSPIALRTDGVVVDPSGVGGNREPHDASRKERSTHDKISKRPMKESHAANEGAAADLEDVHDLEKLHQNGFNEKEEPSVIVVDSQSQQDVSAPRSARLTQSTIAQQASFELPSEVEDSQPSKSSKTLDETNHKSPVLEEHKRPSAPREKHARPSWIIQARDRPGRKDTETLTTPSPAKKNRPSNPVSPARSKHSPEPEESHAVAVSVTPGKSDFWEEHGQRHSVGKTSPCRTKKPQSRGDQVKNDKKVIQILD